MKTIVLFWMSAVLLWSIPAASVFSQAAQQEKGPQIVFESETYDYGKIFVNGDGNSMFRFTNTGNEPLLLTSVRAGCGCTVPDWPRAPILPGDTAVINVNYITLSRPHTINRSIVVTTNAVNKPTVILRLRGEVIARPEGFSPVKTLDDATSPTAN